MLLIQIGKREKDILLIEVAKHAVKKSDDDELYKLVCAGVSSIIVGLCNCIDLFDENCCDISFNFDKENPEFPNHITIRVINNSPELQSRLDVGFIQLRTINESYSDYIDFKITEV